ncbi:hypothetical protein [Geodermatophilus saharensis]|nr:hypothetical protein [Geodermatophilus saharensis]
MRPTAQNVFVCAAASGRRTVVARDVVLLTTRAPMPVLAGLSVLLG